MSKIKTMIEKENWHSNCPSAKAIMEKWRPPRKEEVETNPHLMKLVNSQKWKYLAVVDPSPKAGEGKGESSFKPYAKKKINK